MPYIMVQGEQWSFNECVGWLLAYGIYDYPSPYANRESFTQFFCDAYNAWEARS